MSANITLPPSIRDGVYLTLVFGFGLSTIAIGIRVYTKLRIMKEFLSEDYFSIVGYCSLATYLGLVLGIGKSGNVEYKGYLSMVATVIYDITIVLAKTSILLQFITLFVVHRKNHFHYICHAFIGANAIMYTVIIFLYIFECNPREKLWIPSIPGKCFGKYGLSTGYINVISDFLILALPLPTILRLKVHTRKKLLRPLLVFGIGSFACVASLIRLVYSFHVNAPPGSVAHQLQIDREGLLAFAEISIGIIVGCLPIVNRFVKHYPLKLPMISGFSAFSSSHDGSSWRRLFNKSWKSSSSEKSGSIRRLRTKDSNHTASAVPKIQTLNMTRASFTLEDMEPLKWPQPVHDRNGGTGKGLPRDPYLPADDDGSASLIEEAIIPPDLENQAPKMTRSWQQLEEPSQNQTNKTRRAQYDLM